MQHARRCPHPRRTPHPPTSRRACWLPLAVGMLCAAGGMAWAGDEAPTARLAEEGLAASPIIIAEGADERTRDAAQTLADYLGRISGATFNVDTGDGASGIVVGSAKDFPTLELDHLFDPDDVFGREVYLLRSSSTGLLIIGATPVAVEHAVWDLLYRLGHRQFFPGPTWEVVPEAASLAIAVDTLEKPDFHTRLIWYGFGLWGYNNEPYAQWCARNRAVRGFDLSTSHVYQAIVRRNRDAFDEHPEYFALVDGERGGTKFCIANPGLRQLVIEDRLAFLRENPDQDSVSLDPSDGGGWCECDECAALGSITDRVLLLANETAEAVSEKFPDKYVGLLAYNQHSPPPNIDVHPHVLVKVQTAFIRGGYTFDEVIEGWQARGAVTGVGDYYSIFQSDMSRPAMQTGSNLHHIRTSIPEFHRQGARFFMTESSDAWGAIGLGHYLAARLVWDIAEAERFDELVDDFLTNAFGPAREPMERFFRLIYRFDADDRQPMIRADMLARMYRLLDEARRLAHDEPAVMARLDELLLFTRYEELTQGYRDASGGARQEAVEALIRHAWRMRETMMVHSKPIVNADSRRLAGRDRHVEPPPAERVQVDEPFTTDELERILAEGIANTEVVEVGFEPVTFSRDLVPATPLNLPEVERGDYNRVAPMGRQHFHTWLDEPGELVLRISGGHIVHYRDIASEVQTRLYAEANPILDAEVALDQSVPPDGTEHDVALKSPYEGLHHVEVWPPTNRAMVEPADPSTAWTMESSLDRQNRLTSLWSLYLYVPEGTAIVGGFASGTRGSVLDGDGEKVFSFADDMEMPGYFSIDVPEGQDGKLWKLEQCTGERRLMTVPPFLARSGAELLLPREVVEADARP